MPVFTAENSKQVRDRRREQTVRTPPEPLLTLEEACQRYFPGKSACALRWMIKRKGYAHSRWGREYRLTPSQVAAIVADLARPAVPAQAVEPRPAAVPRRGRPATRQIRATAAPATAGPEGAETPGRQPAHSRRTLEERLSAPLSGTAT
jgi:hypothetical protein